MNITQIPYCTVNWSEIEPVKHLGETGYALWRTQTFGPEDNPICVHMAEYSPGYATNN